MKTNTVKTLLVILLSIVYNNLNASEPVNGKTYFIESYIGDSNRFLQANSATPSQRSSFSTNSFNNDLGQRYTLKDAGDGYFYILSNISKDQAVHVYGANPNRRAEVTLWPLKDQVLDQPNMKWRFVAAEDDYYYIQSQLGTFLDVQLESSAKKTPVWMWDGNSSKAQKWKLHNITKPITYTKDFEIDPISNLCPTRLMKGDREFAGNGPNISGKVQLAHNENKLFALIEFNAKETKSDWSHVKGEWIKVILSLPSSYKIIDILSDYSRSGYSYNITRPSGGYGLTPGYGLPTNSPVSRMVVEGDTNGDDISSDNDCSDDTNIRYIEFKPVTLRITYSPR